MKVAADLLPFLKIWAKQPNSYYYGAEVDFISLTDRLFNGLEISTSNWIISCSIYDIIYDDNITFMSDMFERWEEITRMESVSTSLKPLDYILEALEYIYNEKNEWNIE